MAHLRVYRDKFTATVVLVNNNFVLSIVFNRAGGMYYRAGGISG